MHHGSTNVPLPGTVVPLPLLLPGPVQSKLSGRPSPAVARKALSFADSRATIAGFAAETSLCSPGSVMTLNSITPPFGGVGGVGGDGDGDGDGDGGGDGDGFVAPPETPPSHCSPFLSIFFFKKQLAVVLSCMEDEEGTR